MSRFVMALMLIVLTLSSLGSRASAVVDDDLSDNSIKALIEAFAVVKDDIFMEYLFRSIRYNRVDRAQEYAAHIKPADFQKAIDDTGLPILHQVIVYARSSQAAIEMLKALMPFAHADIKRFDDVHHNTVLHLAAQKNWPDVIDYLMGEFKFEVVEDCLEWRNTKGLTAAQEAFVHANQEATEVLVLKYKSKLDTASWTEANKASKHRFNNSSLLDFTRVEVLNLVNTLLKKGQGKISLKDLPYYYIDWSHDLRTTMLQAASWGHYDVLKSFADLVQNKYDKVKYEQMKKIKDLWLGILFLTFRYYWQLDFEVSKKIAQLAMTQDMDINGQVKQWYRWYKPDGIQEDEAWKKQRLADKPTSLLYEAISTGRVFFVGLLIDAGIDVTTDDVKAARSRRDGFVGDRSSPHLRQLDDIVQRVEAGYAGSGKWKVLLSKIAELSQCVALLQ